MILPTQCRWDLCSIDLLCTKSNSKDYKMIFKEPNNKGDLVLEIGKKKKKGRLKDSLTGSYFYFDVNEAKRLLDAQNKEIARVVISILWNTKRGKENQKRLNLILNIMTDKLTLKEVERIEYFYRNNIADWKRFKKLSITIPKSQNLLPRDVKVIRNYKSKLYVLVFPEDKQKFEKKGAAKKLLPCTEDQVRIIV